MKCVFKETLELADHRIIEAGEIYEGDDAQGYIDNGVAEPLPKKKNQSTEGGE